ncbi:OmpH family outer membrane protein [Singulisphaera acidiphila]|nr:OmpH family outer membrane protein [Singulisphaera acidiphila]
MSTHRLRAPSDDGALLAVPPLGEAAPVTAGNVERLGRWDYDFQGRRSSRLRGQVRSQVLKGARDYLTRLGLDVPAHADSSVPLVVTGHQPELYHPGVWVKNFAVAALAQHQRGIGLNFIVDNDLHKSSAIRVPQKSVDGGLQVQRVEYDQWTGDLPFEDLNVKDEGLFESFGTRVRAVLTDSVADPLIDTFWPLVLKRREQTRRLGLRFAAARRELEGSWGVHNAEIPLSAVCETEGFLWFASHLLADLPRFQTVHNEALARYRARYQIRSRHHPVPALSRQDEWREAPFWVWRGSEPRRRSLFVRQLPRTMELRAGGEDQPFLELPLAPDRDACCAVEQLLNLPAQRIRLRTRALTTTMFARLLLGDLFVHGIGGAKYDELGDEIIRGFFAIEPPDYLTLSMTLWLGLGLDPAGAERLASLNRSLRDLTYNPDRHVAELTPETQALVAAKQAAIASSVASHQERLARFQEIRRLNESLQVGVNPIRDQLQAEQARMVAVVGRNVVARNREYAFVLHSERRLHEVLVGSMGLPASGE